MLILKSVKKEKAKGKTDYRFIKESFKHTQEMQRLSKKGRVLELEADRLLAEHG